MAQQHTLYAYALPTGSPIDVVGLFDAIQHFLADRVWTCPDIWLVSPNGSESPEVGVNMVLPNPGSEPPGWFADVEAIALFCAHSLTHFNCDFVIGASDGRQADDITEIDSDDPKISFIKRFLG